MSTLPYSVGDSSSASAALRTGAALAVTAAVFYTLCALAWLAAPGPFLNFINSLFHGMDFTPLINKAAPFSWLGFVEAELVVGIWAFGAGCFYGWLRERLG